MESERVSTPVPYEPPAVESRERIDAPLVATVGSNVITAAFHPIDDAEPYEPPAVESRERIDAPLVAVAPSG